MRKIRIGNDLAVQWSLVAKGTGEPFVVEGKDIRLSLKSIFSTTEIEDFTAQGNKIAWTFKGAEQKQTGIYSLVVSVVDAQGAMVTTDVCQFVELVACSCEADGADEAGVHTESIDLVSNVEIGGGVSITPDWNAREGEEGYIKNKPFDFGTADEYAVKEVEVVPSHEDGSEVNVTLLEWVYDEEGYSGYWDNYDWLGEDPYLRISMPYTETIITKPSELRRGKELWGLYIDSITGNVQYNGYFQSETTIKVELAGSIIPLHESFIPDTIARKQELTELSAEVSGLSERIDKLPTAESSVFEAVYGETTYDEIIEAYNAGKYVVCLYEELAYHLSSLKNNAAWFGAIDGDFSFRTWCDKSNVWRKVQYNLELSSNKTKTISETSTDTQYPSAKAVYDFVNNTLGTIINGEY